MVIIFKELLADVKDKLTLKIHEDSSSNGKDYFVICLHKNKLNEFNEIDYWVMKNDICILKNFYFQPLNNSETYEYYLKLFGTTEEKKE